MRTVTDGHVNRELPWWPDWTADAECARPEYDPDMMFDLGGSGKNRRKILRLKEVCYRCPVITECLRDNMTLPYGIVGGMTPGERWRMIERKYGRLNPNEPLLRRARNGFSSYDHYSGKPQRQLTRPPKTYRHSASELLTNLESRNHPLDDD